MISVVQICLEPEALQDQVEVDEDTDSNVVHLSMPEHNQGISVSPVCEMNPDYFRPLSKLGLEFSIHGMIPNCKITVKPLGSADFSKLQYHICCCMHMDIDPPHTEAERSINEYIRFHVDKSNHGILQLTNPYDWNTITDKNTRFHDDDTYYFQHEKFRY